MSPMSLPIILLGLVALALMAGAFVSISEHQRGGLVRLGKYVKTLGPGWHIRVPVFDRVTKVDLDTSIPGWQTLSDRDLEEAVETFVTVGVWQGGKAAATRPPRSKTGHGTFDAPALSAWLLKTASEETGVDLSKDPMAQDRIAQSAKGALEELRSSGSCEVNLPFLTASATGPKHFVKSLTRSQMEKALGSTLG